jgi:hypothetical protein
MAGAILASEPVEELSLIELLAVLALVLTEFSGLPKDFLMRDRPCDAGDGETKQ